MAVKTVDDLELTPEQRFALGAISMLSLGLRSMPSVGGKALAIAMGPVLLQAVTAVMQNTACPFDSPPSDIVGDYDSDRNMYSHCNHSPRHCWDGLGKYIPCPS